MEWIDSVMSKRDVARTLRTVVVGFATGAPKPLCDWPFPCTLPALRKGCEILQPHSVLAVSSPPTYLDSHIAKLCVSPESKAYALESRHLQRVE